MRKHRSAETRWANSFLSPEEPRWDRRGRGTKGAEFMWELHTSHTDVDIARSSRSKCSCHSLTSDDDNYRTTDRGDLRKHHSAETDKWSLHPDAGTSRHHLRKHNSDDTRMARDDSRWTLQVPEVLPNPKTRCTCSKGKRLSLSPGDSRPSGVLQGDTAAKWVYHPQPTTPEDQPTSKSVAKKHSETKVEVKSPNVRVKSSGRELKRQTRVDQGSTKRWEPKERTFPDDEIRKITQSRWAGKTHLSLPTQTQGASWFGGQKSLGETNFVGKNSSVKEKQKSAMSKSLSPESIVIDRTSLRLDGIEATVGRQAFPEIAVTDVKWTPFESRSPLPKVGNARKREQKVADAKCRTPIDDPTENWSPFRHVTPTFFPPLPQRSPQTDDDGRWKLLNQISPFPIYQGAWKEYSPPAEVQLKVPSPEKPLTSRSPTPSSKIIDLELPSEKLSTTRRTKSEEVPVEPSESRNRQRPQLVRSKALLEVPTMDAAKRSLSEEVPRYRMNEITRGPNRAKSEEGPNYGDPWFANNLASESTELCQYVTTV
ncbi:uncharacterized protein LOC112694985 [Athalia rosae]|uniref:uncharacterized protein LOC112694985 n=1 Tax=Athalia rosae TaxID=37344 RepID=UPI0020347CD1|nr:uncharacterized protein LOC112694985 [Athalia rosae]